MIFLSDWFLPTLLSAFLLGFYDVCKKHAVNSNAVLPVLLFSNIFGFAALIIVDLLQGKLVAAVGCDWHVFRLILLKSAIVSSSWVLAFYAMRELPISISSPINSTRPFWTLLGGIIFFQEIPGLMPGIGIAVVLVGLYLFSLVGKKEGLGWSNRGILLMISGTILGAVSAVYDKYLLNTCGIALETIQLYFSFNSILIFLAVLLIRSFWGQRHSFQWRWSIPAIGVLIVLADYIYFYAVSLPGTPISMVSLVRRSCCIVSFAAGSLIFHERHLRMKTIGLLILIVGLLIIAFNH